MPALDHPDYVARRLRKWLGVARRTARNAYRRRVMPDFSAVVAGLEQDLLPSFVYSYRRGMARGRYLETGKRRTKVDGRPTDKEEDRRWWTFSAGAAVLALAVKNTVVRIVDWMGRTFRKAIGLPKTPPLSDGSVGTVNSVLPMPDIGLPVRDGHAPTPLPPIAPPAPKPAKPGAAPAPPTKSKMPPASVIDFDLAPALAIVQDELYGLSQRAILEYARQIGMGTLEWYATLDERTCPVCVSLHGKVARPGHAFGFLANGTPVFHAPAHTRCRCRLVRPTKGRFP